MSRPSPTTPQLHRCGVTQPVPVGTKVVRAPWKTIDVHCHLFTPEADAAAREYPAFAEHQNNEAAALGEASRQVNVGQMSLLAPKLTSVEARLADMDAMGVDIQLVSPSPTQYHYWADEDLSDRLVNLQNNAVSALCEGHPDRFCGLGTLAMQHPERAADQLKSLIRDRGFKGVQVSSLIAGKDLADRYFDPFWQMADQLGAIVFIHPWGTTLGTRLAEHYLMNTVGQPLETTICLSKLIFGGTLDRHKQVRIISAHGGGYLPMYSGRSDHAYLARPDARHCSCCPSEQLRKIWFDTVVHDKFQLRQLIERVGADRLVLGTDYPFDMGHYDPANLVAELPEDQQRMILGANVEQLLARVGGANPRDER